MVESSKKAAAETANNSKKTSSETTTSSGKKPAAAETPTSSVKKIAAETPTNSGKKTAAETTPSSGKNAAAGPSSAKGMGPAYGRVVSRKGNMQVIEIDETVTRETVMVHWCFLLTLVGFIVVTAAFLIVLVMQLQFHKLLVYWPPVTADAPVASIQTTNADEM